MSEADPSLQTTLQLGDIISFDAPVNPDLHDRAFLIKYIDNDQIVLVDEQTLNEQVLLIDEQGNLTDQSIESIAILDRDEQPGYARQNGLVPGEWINIRFGGDVPAVITGEITNLDEDMIEVKVYPTDETIYIDFGYKGIPKDLPIDKIELRSQPDSARRVPVPDAQQAPPLPAEEEEGVEAEVEELAPVDIEVPVADIRAQLREMILGADQIQIGEDLGVIEQEVDIGESKYRFGIETQTNDMLNELLSTIPNSQRTQSVLNSIQTMIDRFVQLREEFSTFNEQGQAYAPKIHGPNYKPLVTELMQLNHNILWLLPIAKNRKVLFEEPGEGRDVLELDGFEEETGDFILLTPEERREEIAAAIKAYYSNRSADGQNKYDYLIQQLNNVAAPFIPPRDDSNFIESRTVSTNLTTVIDNLEDFKSTVVRNNRVVQTRFLITKYELGQKRLQQTRLRNGKLAITSIPITAAQQVAIKGFVTLPESMTYFAKANMPRTNIMLRSQLAQNYIGYWKVLRQTTRVENTTVENLDSHVDYDRQTFLSRVRSFMLDESIDDADRYERFLQAIMPKTRVLFELIKKHVKNAYSLYSILEYLEPFFVYHSDLSFKQYEAMTGYIRFQIKEYKKSLGTARKEFQYIQSLGDSVDFNYGLATLIDVPDVESFVLFVRYGLAKVIDGRKEALPYGNMEQLQTIIKDDNAKLYSSALAIATENLMVPDEEILEDLSSDIREVERDYYNTLYSKGLMCSAYTLAKKYKSLTELEADNNTDVFFDKQFDRTDYSFIKKYEQERRDMGDARFVSFLAQQYLDTQDPNVKTREEAERDAAAMIAGKRVVLEGDFAVLVTDEEDGNKKLQNYERKDGQWVISRVTDNLLPTFDLGAICAAQEDCIPTKEGCDDAGATALLNEAKTLRDSIKFFAELYPKRRRDMKAFIAKRYEQAWRQLDVKREIAEEQFNRISRIAHKLGLSAIDTDVKESPYATLRDLVLSQGDFVKRQYDVLRFANKFTYVPIASDDVPEDAQYWLFCNVTGVKLLPSFLSELARTFIEQPEEYTNVLEQICADRGTLSDDGENWVDKYSGYIICPIQYSSEEGYTAQGFRVKTRSELIEDLGNSVLESEIKERKFESPDAEKVAKAVWSLAGLMGISVDSHLEFIIRNTLIKQKTFPNQAEYDLAMERMAKQGKKTKRISYEDAYNSNLLLLTFAYYLVAIQAAIPEITTKRTYPGCKKAFRGYPLDGTTDLAAVTYVACIARTRKDSPEQPWKSIQSLKEPIIVKKIQGIIDRFILTDSTIQEMFQEKKEYLQLQAKEEVPIELDIKSWTNFLPPLVSPKVSQLQPLAKDFQSKLIVAAQQGSADQFLMINQAISRIANYSVAIQSLVQSVVSKEALTLTNGSGQPFLQNSCCQTQYGTTYGYFVDREGEIAQYNKIVGKISELLDGMGLAAKAPILFDPQDTKIPYPSISAAFTEDTIYRAMVALCRFNSPLPVPPELLPVCEAKPDDINTTDSVEDIVKQLRSTGRVYTTETLDALLAIVNAQNTVHLDLDPIIVSKVQQLRDILFSITEMEQPVVDGEIAKMQMDILDVFEVAKDGRDVGAEVRSLRNRLSSLTSSNIESVQVFVVENATKLSRRERNVIDAFLRQPTGLPASSPTPLMTAEQNAVYMDLSLAQRLMRNIVEVIPNMVLNQVNANPTIPSSWGISLKHMMDVRKFVNDYYDDLRTFYGDSSLDVVMKAYLRKNRLLVQLIDRTVYLASPDEEESRSVLDAVTVKLLINYYISLAFRGFVELANDEDALAAELAQSVFTERRQQTSVAEMAATGDVDVSAVMEGERQELRKRIASFISTVIEMMNQDKQIINYNHDSVKERVLRNKEFEKDMILDELDRLTDEERIIQNNFKRAKLGRWGKGLKRGVFQYVAEDYDEEREAIDEQLRRERRVNAAHQPNDMNRDIYMMEMEEQERADAEMDAEAYDMSGIGEDDDDGYDQEPEE